ncbi:MAG: hypothetical protein EP332_14810 [Bacteroidetes bacterium]|nr:MAG: hypothetical protein EP332_14810 [Bacteroidota bacterium]
MEVEIIEYANPGHFTLVDSVARIFSSESKNQVSLSVRPHHTDNAHKLIVRLQRSNLNTNSFSFNKVTDSVKVIITPEHELDYLLNCTDKGRTWMFVHNIDDWFDLGVLKGFRQATDAFLKDKNPKLAYFLLKRVFRDNPKKRKAVERIIADAHSYFVVINNTLRDELAKLVPIEKIKVIPFSVYDASLKDLSTENQKIRIAIPGLLSQKRRDYTSVFKSMETWSEELLSKIEIDLLGGISDAAGERSAEVVNYAEKLIKQGYPIILRNSTYIELDEFDHELSKADIILGNLNIDQGGGSKYGKTKESGIPFTMIRAAKPGILPVGYSTIQEVQTSTVFVEDYYLLSEVLCKMIDTSEIKNLKSVALDNSQFFKDKNIYQQIWE